MNYTKLIQFLATVGLVSAQSFCSSAKHSGQSVTEYSNKVSSINGIGYELWSDSGSNSATFYSDGSFSCSFRNAGDYLCRSGLSFDSTQSYQQIGHMYADFKLVKQNIQNVDYSYVGIYGWTRSPLVEFYIVDNWLSQYRPGDWVGNKKHGDYMIDGAMYTVFENDRFGPSIDGDTQFKQYFSIRQQARDCGTIDINAHFEQWEKLGMKMGKMHEAKVLGEAGSNNGGTSGTADFPYAKVYIGNGNNGGGNSQQPTQQQQQDNQGGFDWWSSWNMGGGNNDNTQAATNSASNGDFCSSSKHSGQSVTEYSNKVSSINGIGYELWSDSGSNSATFYSDGSFSCSFRNAGDYLCRSGLSFDSTQSYQQIGHMYADFKLVKQNIQNVDYSYVGIYGWTRSPLVEFYIVDNWLSQYRPGDWVGNKKHGDFTIDGAKYTVYENTRYGPSIDGDTQFKQYFSIRQQARDCGTIDINAHFDQWEKLGMKLGKMHEAKVLGEAGSNNGGTSGTADFPYAKVYIDDGFKQQPKEQPVQQPVQQNPTQQATQQQSSASSCSSKITSQGYKCCKSGCQVIYTDADGDWGAENNEWCGCGNRVTTSSGSGKCSSKITSQGYECCSKNCVIYYSDADGDWGVENGEWCGCGAGESTVPEKTNDTPSASEKTNDSNYCSSAKHTGQSVTEYSNKVGNIGDIGYELWSDSGSNSATFYSDGSFSCSFKNAKDYLCRSGLSFDSTQSHDQIGHLYAEFKLVKQNIQNVDYSYVGIYGWTRSPLVEYYIVDNWLSQYRPGDWVGNKKHGDFTIDGAEYTVYENTRYGPSIDGDTQFKQFFSIRKEPRDCGKIDITAHFQQWEKLGMKLGKMHEAKVLGEAGSNGSGTSGTADFPYAKVYIGNGNSSGNTGGANFGNTPVAQQQAAQQPAAQQQTNFCSSAKHSGQSVTEYSNKVSSINGIGYELWSDSGSNSATFYSDGSFSCSFRNAGDYLCRSGLSFDSTQSYQQIGHMYADFKLVKQNIQNVDYSYVGIYGWTRSPLVEFYIVDNWLSQYRPGDWVGNKKHGDFMIDGAMYTVFENDRFGPSIDGDTQFKQYFSIRQQARDCGTIDINAHFEQWEKLGMKMGKMHEAKVLGEAGSNNGGTSGTADFPYAKVYIGNGGNTGGANTGGANFDNAAAQAPATSYPKGTGFQFYTQCKNRNHWAMTFDDGPTQYADSILDLLKKYDIKATFFLVGDLYMKSYDSNWSRIVKRMYNEGHVVGSHTYSHKDLTQLSSQQIIQEMQQLEDAVYNAIGKRPAFMRPPYGSGNGNQNVMSTLQGFGITAACTWYVDPMDWDNGGNIGYAKQVFGKLNGEGVISLNHLEYGGSSAQGIIDLATAEIELMKFKGYKAVTMEECLGMSAYK